RSDLSSAVNVTEDVPSNISLPAVRSSEPLDTHPAPQTVQNHIYKLESDLGDPSQEAFRLDQELLARGWDAKRYPWRMIQQGASRKAILYGTALAQQMIWDHQHPRRDCRDVKILIFRTGPGGIGSMLHQLGQALALAMELDRVLVVPVKDTLLQYYDKRFCPGAHSWQCWLQEIGLCADVHGDVMKVDNTQTSRPVPARFHEMLAQSPIKKDFWVYWWRAQSITYLLRFQERTRHAIDKLRSESLVSCGQHANSSGVLAAGSMATFVRHGLKKQERVVEHDLGDYVREMQRLAAGRQDLRILHREVAESNASFQYPAESFAARNIFVSTDDPAVIKATRKLCKRGWNVTYVEKKRANYDPWMHLRPGKAARTEVLSAFMNLELALESDAWVCTLSSNWCRLIDELRMTAAAKASQPFLNLEKGLFVHVSNLAGEELCSVEVPENTKSCDLKGTISRQLGLYPYAFKLITLISGATVGGGGFVSSISQDGRLDLTLVKIDGIPTPDSRGYLQLQPEWGESAAPSGGRTRCATRVLAFLATLAAAIFMLDGSYCGLLLVYAVYLLEALFLNPTARGLLRLKHTDDIVDYIEEVKACRPIPEVQARCYHHERRTRVVRKPDGSTKTVVYTKRVDTATFTERLQVRRWADMSGEVVEGLSYFPLLQVHFELKWQAADDETRRTHEQQQHQLRLRAANADASYDITKRLSLVDPAGHPFTLYSDMIGTTGHRLPRCLGFWPYVVSSLFGLSWPYRYWLGKHAVKDPNQLELVGFLLIYRSRWVPGMPLQISVTGMGLDRDDEVQGLLCSQPHTVRIVLSTTLICAPSAGADSEACPTCRSENGRAADDLALLQHHLSSDEVQGWPRRARRKRRPRMQRRVKEYYSHDNGDNIPDNPTTTADLPPDVPVPTVPVTTTTATTTTAAPMWILGDLHDTCNDLCQFNGYGGCGADEIAELDTAAKVEDQILNTTGQTCSTMPTRSYGAFFDPDAMNPGTGKCFYVSGTVDCDRNDKNYEQPLCFCNGTTVTTTPDAGWLVAELHDTCNDFCHFNGFDGCNANRIQEINRHPRATRLLEGLGYNCSSTVAARDAGIFFDPPGTPGTAGKCFYTSGTVDCDVNTKPYEKPVCQCSTVTTATTTPDAGWLVAELHDTCNDFCHFNGFDGCNATRIQEINRHPRATRLLEGLGYNCSSTVAARDTGIFFDPPGTPGTAGKCFYTSGTVDCDVNTKPYEKPVCYCSTVTTATTTPDATRWQLGGLGETCDDVCTFGCNEAMMAEINRHPRATRLLEGLGYNCSSTVAGRSYGIFFDPPGTAGTAGKCLYASGPVDCGRNDKSYEQPLCYCNPPPP
ncbi:set5, partial [Symbiodinium sp. CCMP2456]